MTPALVEHLATVAATAVLVLVAQSAVDRRRHRRTAARRERLLAHVRDSPSRMVAEAWSPGCEVFRPSSSPTGPCESMPPIPAALLAQLPQRAGWCSHGDHCTHHPKET